MGTLDFRGYPGVSINFGGQISCKSQANPIFWVSIPWVFVDIRGYSLVLLVKSLVNSRVILFLGLNFLGFRGYPEVSILFVVQILVNQRLFFL